MDKQLNLAVKYNYLISIVIPTKNRAKYAFYAVKQILAIDSNLIQVVIQDNSSTEELKILLSEFLNDKRLKYNYSSEILSVVENFNIGVSLAEGEYICAIGDDDGVNPQIIAIAEWAKKNRIIAIKSGLNVIYTWPDNNTSLSDELHGVLDIYKFSGNGKEVKTEVSKLLQNGCLNYLDLNLVKIYHGLVRKEYMDEVKNLSGTYFGGLSSDIYSAVALSLIIDKFIVIDYPITISGICNKSTSADSKAGRHIGNLENAPHFSGVSHFQKYEWSREVPKFYSVETIWADSALAAIRKIRPDLLDEFDTSMLTVRCLIKHREYYNIIWSHYNSRCSYLGISKLNSILKLIISFIRGPVKNRLRSKLAKFIIKDNECFKFNNIKNIMEALDVFSSYLVNNNINIDNILRDLEKTINDN